MSKNDQYLELTKRLSELRVALSSTKTLLTSDSGMFHNDFVLRQCCKKYLLEIERLEKLLYDNSNDQGVY